MELNDFGASVGGGGGGAEVVVVWEMDREGWKERCGVRRRVRKVRRAVFCDMACVLEGVAHPQWQTRC